MATIPVKTFHKTKFQCFNPLKKKKGEGEGEERKEEYRK
jgi:hypothetical protein